MTTSNSPKRALLSALATGSEAILADALEYRPKKFTPPQLFACMVLQEFLRLVYRRLQALFIEAANAYAREDHGQPTIIPSARRRPTSKPRSDRWRRLMSRRFNQQKHSSR